MLSHAPGWVETFDLTWQDLIRTLVIARFVRRNRPITAGRHRQPAKRIVQSIGPSGVDRRPAYYVIVLMVAIEKFKISSANEEQDRRYS